MIEVDFEKGLVPVVAVHALTGEVLMVAYTDREALEHTERTGELHFHSRRRGLWKKGETSGNVLKVRSLALDCDRDAIVARVLPAGPTCHTGTRSCFTEDARSPLVKLDDTLAARAAEPTGYTGKLLQDRNLRLKKLGEEAAELAVACADNDRARAVEEAADLLYHSLVALRPLGAGLADLAEALEKRQR